MMVSLTLDNAFITSSLARGDSLGRVASAGDSPSLYTPSDVDRIVGSPPWRIKDVRVKPPYISMASSVAFAPEPQVLRKNVSALDLAAIPEAATDCELTETRAPHELCINLEKAVDASAAQTQIAALEATSGTVLQKRRPALVADYTAAALDDSRLLADRIESIRALDTWLPDARSCRARAALSMVSDADTLCRLLEGDCEPLSATFILGKLSNQPGHLLRLAIGNSCAVPLWVRVQAFACLVSAKMDSAAHVYAYAAENAYFAEVRAAAVGKIDDQECLRGIAATECQPLDIRLMALAKIIDVACLKTLTETCLDDSSFRWHLWNHLATPAVLTQIGTAANTWVKIAEQAATQEQAYLAIARRRFVAKLQAWV